MQHFLSRSFFCVFVFHTHTTTGTMKRERTLMQRRVVLGCLFMIPLLLQTQPMLQYFQTLEVRLVFFLLSYNAYLGETGLLIAITAPGLGQIISTMQSPDFINEVLVGAIPLALGLIKSTAQSQGIDNVAAAGVALTHIAANVMMGPTTTLDDFFNDPTWVAPVLPVIGLYILPYADLLINSTGFATWAAGAGLSPDPIPAPLGQALFDCKCSCLPRESY